MIDARVVLLFLHKDNTLARFVANFYASGAKACNVLTLPGFGA